jgi:hypothetical protein
MASTPLGDERAVERLTWQQICARHVNEWVVLVDVEWGNDDDLDPRSGIVLGHSKDPRTVLMQTRPLRPKGCNFAHLHTAPLPRYEPDLMCGPVTQIGPDDEEQG